MTEPDDARARLDNQIAAMEQTTTLHPLDWLVLRRCVADLLARPATAADEALCPCGGTLITSPYCPRCGHGRATDLPAASAEGGEAPPCPLPWYVEAFRPQHEDEARVYDARHFGVFKPTCNSPAARRPLAEWICRLANSASAPTGHGEADPIPISGTIQREIERLNADSSLWETPSATRDALYAFARMVLAQARDSREGSPAPASLGRDGEALREKAEAVLRIIDGYRGDDDAEWRRVLHDYTPGDPLVTNAFADAFDLLRAILAAPAPASRGA